jgi:hypothetical protein
MRLCFGISFLPAAKEAIGNGTYSKGRCKGKERPKAKLGLPNLDHSKAAVLNSLRSPEIHAPVSLGNRGFLFSGAKAI